MTNESKKLSGILLSLVMLAVLILPICTAKISMSEMPKITVISPKEGATIPTGNIVVVAPMLKIMSVKNVTISLVAKNIAFNKTKITVPAGANITVNFDNQDSYLTSGPHNFAVYTDASAKTAIFQGKTIKGPAKTTYTFTAPTEAGTYFFRCDIHPTTMTGQFIVQ